MPDAAWPLTLTRPPRVSELSEKPAGVVLRTAMDVGPAKARRRSLARVTNWTVALDLTGTQLATFMDFFSTACAGGAIPFTWIHPRTGAADTRFRFTSEPENRPRGPREGGDEYWSVSFSMEQLP